MNSKGNVELARDREQVQDGIGRASGAGNAGRGMADYLKPVYAAVVPIAAEEIAAAVLALIEDESQAGVVVELPNAPRAEA